MREVLGLDFEGGEDHVGMALEWGVRRLGKRVAVHAEGDLPAKAVADLFPAYDDDGGLLLVLTPVQVGARPNRPHSGPPVAKVPSRRDRMSERRRSLFVLLLVAVLIAGSIVVILTKPTKLGLDLQGGVQLIYHAEPTAQQTTVDADAMQRLDRPHPAARQRVRRLRGRDQPGRLRPDRGRPAGRQERRARGRQQVGSTAQLFFYDWEANLLDAKLQDEPGHQRRTRCSRSSALYKAVDAGVQVHRGRHAGEGTIHGASQAAAKPRFYAFDKKHHKPLANGQTSETRQDALDALTARAEGERGDPRGPGRRARPARREGQRRPPPTPDRWWVIQDRPGLSGTDIKDPEQSFDQSVGNEPIVTFNFTAKGRKAFQEITRKVAQRGADNAFGGDPIADLAALRDRARQRSWSPRPTSTGARTRTASTARTGAQISGGFTIQTAQDLAKILKIGALPLKLSLVSRSQVCATLGKQALDQGLKAGIAGFIIVALFLIIFYRVLGVVATLALAIYALYFYALVKLIPITMTLPGIAGLILTLGVAADANIVVFERVKEEVRAGRGVLDSRSSRATARA